MKHHKSFRKFGREKNERKAFIKSLIMNLVRHGRMETTLARAKEVRPFIEKLVTLAKEDSVARRRLIAARVYNNDEVVTKTFNDYAKKYKDVAGGYTRIIHLSTRISDGAEKALIEFV